jgi:adenylate kinase
MKLVLVGIQGAGKSTQGNLLADKLKVPYLSTGHIFRVLAKEHTPEGRYIKEVMNAGHLIPDERTITIVNDYLARPEYKTGYIMDGFPRNLHQAESFTEKLDHVIYLKVSDKEALWRLAFREGGEIREDETVIAIRKRIELFHEKTQPILEYYKKQHMLLEVNGEQTIEDIHKEIMKHLKHE